MAQDWLAHALTGAIQLAVHPQALRFPGLLNAPVPPIGDVLRAIPHWVEYMGDAGS